MFNNVATRVGKSSGDTWIQLNNPHKWFREWVAKPASRFVRDAIEAEDSHWKIEMLKKTFNNVFETVDDIETFDTYLFARSRLNQSISFDWDLKTVIKQADWTPKELTNNDFSPLSKNMITTFKSIKKKIFCCTM